jgi:uncharacterized RDD family membrane protein YckC
MNGKPAAAAVRAAGIGRRLMSLMYEGLLVFAVVFFAGLTFYGLTGGRLTGLSRLLFQLYLFAVLGMYFVFCWRRSGQTLPMKTWRLRVVSAEGGPLSLRQAWLRYLLGWPSVLLVGIGLLWALFDRDRQFLHDRLAKTRVIEAPGRDQEETEENREDARPSP